MSRDQVLSIVSFLLSSLLLFSVLNVFLAVVLIVLDLLWLFYWLAFKKTEKNLPSKTSRNLKVASVALILVTTYLLQKMNFMEIDLSGIKELLALFPLIVLFQINLSEKKDA